VDLFIRRYLHVFGKSFLFLFQLLCLKIKLLEKNLILKLILDYIRNKQLNWYGHVRRMNEERLPQKVYNGIHLQKQ
jgi:hypothetical protein